MTTKTHSRLYVPPNSYHTPTRTRFFDAFDHRPDGQPVIAFVKENTTEDWCPSQPTAQRWLRDRREHIDHDSSTPQRRRAPQAPLGRRRLNVSFHIETMANRSEPLGKKDYQYLQQQAGCSYATLRRRIIERKPELIRSNPHKTSAVPGSNKRGTARTVKKSSAKSGDLRFTEFLSPESKMVLEAIRYNDGRLQILNQLKLPHQEEYDEIRTAEEGWHAIKEMRTRGAPAIAIVAALSLAVEVQGNVISDEAEEVAAFITEKLDYLVTSRPTAVNLADATRKLKKVVESASKADVNSAITVSKAYCDAAAQMLIDDVSDNQGIGKYGAEWIAKVAGGGPVSVLTHCNTGSLATAGYGTALGVIRSLHGNGALKRAFCTETRPYNQGSRLTAFELVHDQIPATLVIDSMASALLRQRGREERIAAIVVGADRVAANGDTANKIGTYQLAITAKHHGVKFLVAAPRTTIDLDTKSGADIVIEERPGKEVTMVKGPRFDGLDLDLEHSEIVSIAADGIDVWNPAFDVTPAELIDGIITEIGVVEKGSDGRFDLTLELEAQKEGLKPSTVGGL